MLTALSILFLTLSISPDGEAAPVIDTFIDPRGGPGGCFGYSLAFVGADILIGAPESGCQDPAEIGGAAYLYDGNNGSLLQAFTNPLGSEDGDTFGVVVSGFGSNVVVAEKEATFLMSSTSGNFIREFTQEDGSGIGASSIATFGNNIFMDGGAQFTPELSSSLTGIRVTC